MDERKTTRTERRWMKWRRDQIAVLTVDGRVSKQGAIARVRASRTPDGSRWRSICLYCGKPFEPKRSNAKTCSAKCRMALSRRDRM